MHVARSCPGFHPPASSVPSPQSCPQPIRSSAYTAPGDCPDIQLQGLALGLAEVYGVHTGPFLKLLEVLLNSPFPPA